jgi:glutamine amidotransferase
VDFSLTTGPRTVRQLGEKHPNGWGIGWYEQDKPAVIKEPISAAASERLPAIARHVQSSTVITHVRKATCGEVTESNCHPFQYDNWLFAHNGAVDRESLLTKLSDTHRDSLRGDTDSEVYFHWIMQNIEITKSVPVGVSNAVKVMSNFTGLNFILSNGVHLYAYRNASKNTNYYSLFFLRRDPKPNGMDEFHSSEFRALLRSKALRGERAVLICSERLTDEAWQEIPIGRLLVVSDNLSTDLVEVK